MNNQHLKDGYKLYKSVLDTQKLSNIKNEAVYMFNKQIQRLIQPKDNFVDNLITLFRNHQDVVRSTGKSIQNLASLHSFQFENNILSILERDWNIKTLIVSTKPVLFFHNKNLATEEIYYKTPVHRDSYSVRASLNGVVLWAPLCSTKSVGSLRVIAGSHLRENKLSRFDHSFGLEAVINYREEEFIDVDMELGDMLIFSTNLIHCSGDNKTEDQIRWSLNFRYADADDEDWLNRNYESPYYYKSVVNIDDSLPKIEDLRGLYNVN